MKYGNSAFANARQNRQLDRLQSCLPYAIFNTLHPLRTFRPAYGKTCIAVPFIGHSPIFSLEVCPDEHNTASTLIHCIADEELTPL